jgi:hypothetical protein
MSRHNFRKAFLIPVLALGAIALWPTTSHAQFKQGDYELTLGGTGANNRGFTAGSGGVDLSIGYFFTQNIEVAFRQNFDVASASGTTDFTGESRVAADYNFDFGKWVPFIGANIGGSYGNNGYKGSFEVAPEGGVKYFLNATTFIVAEAEYEIFFRNAHGNSFNGGSWVYSLGLGVRL